MPAETIQYEEAPPQQVPALWPFGAFAAVVTLAFLVTAALNRRKRDLFEGLTSFLQGEAGGNSFFQNFWFKGLYKGRRLNIKYSPGGKNSPSSLTISLDGPPFLFDLKVSVENLFEGFLKTVGLAREISAGDEAFDGRFYLASEVGDLAGRWLGRPAVRAAIEDLFDAGACRLDVLPRGLTISGQVRYRAEAVELERDLSREALLPVLEALDSLCSERHGAEFFGEPPRPGLGRRP